MYLKIAKGVDLKILITRKKYNHVWWLMLTKDYGDHCAICTNIESLCCTPKVIECYV